MNIDNNSVIISLIWSPKFSELSWSFSFCLTSLTQLPVAWVWNGSHEPHVFQSREKFQSNGSVCGARHSCTGTLLRRVRAEGQAVTDKWWLSGLCLRLYSPFLYSVVLYWNGWAHTVEWTIPGAFLLISWHTPTLTTPAILRPNITNLSYTSFACFLLSPNYYHTSHFCICSSNIHRIHNDK